MRTRKVGVTLFLLYIGAKRNLSHLKINLCPKLNCIVLWECGFVYFVSISVMDGGAVQSVSNLSPNDSWGGLQPSSHPEHNKLNGQTHTCYRLSGETEVLITGGLKTLQLLILKQEMKFMHLTLKVQFRLVTYLRENWNRKYKCRCWKRYLGLCS